MKMQKIIFGKTKRLLLSVQLQQQLLLLVLVLVGVLVGVVTVHRGASWSPVLLRRTSLSRTDFAAAAAAAAAADADADAATTTPTLTTTIIEQQ